MFPDEQLYRITHVLPSGELHTGEWMPMRSDILTYWRQTWQHFNSNLVRVELKIGKVLTYQKRGMLTVYDLHTKVTRDEPFIAPEVPKRILFGKNKKSEIPD